jgi:TM2 domain-containing membrane protein YozV
MSAPVAPALHAPQKSVGAAFALSFFFGPFGLFYAGGAGWAVVMILVTVIVAVATIGLGLLLLWPATIVWCCIAAQRYNHRQIEATNARILSATNPDPPAV